MITRALALIGLALACLPSQAVADSGRRSFTLPDTAFDALPPPVPPIDIRGEDIFSLSGLLEVIESIPDLFDQRDYWRTLHTFRELELDDSLPALSASEVHYTIEVTGDWSFEHTGTGQMLKLYAEDEVLHRLNLELPGYEYPWQFAARVPRDGSDVIRRQLVGQLDTVSGNYRDIRAHGFEAVFGAAAQHLFQPRRFPGFSDADLRMLSFEDIPESGIFDSTFTGVEGGSLRADMRDPAGVAFRTWAPVLEYTTEAGHVVPQPTGLGATVSLSICPLVIWESNPRFCDPPLQIDKVTPDPHRENVALADPGFSASFSEPIDLATLEAHFRLHTMDADSRPELVAGEWEVQGQARYVFRPSEDLRSGTLYRAVVPGGEGTILSQDNSAVLAKGQDWTFSTLLDFDQQRPEGPVAGSIRLHHYQVVRDGDLTRNKPTLTRAGLTGIRTLTSTRTGSPRAFRWTSG